MTHEQILQRSINKAIDYGYKAGEIGSDRWLEVIVENRAYFRIIFAHDFAKAFWGEKSSNKKMIAAVVYDEQVKIETGGRPIWKEYLQEMVLTDDPIKYLEQFL